MTEHRKILRGPLEVSSSRDDGDHVLHLRGELDLANADAVERELQRVLAASDCECLVVDMSQLEFIDSTGIATLLRALQTDGAAAKLRFVPSRFAGVTRVLELTGVAERLPPPAATLGAG